MKQARRRHQYMEVSRSTAIERLTRRELEMKQVLHQRVGEAISLDTGGHKLSDPNTHRLRIDDTAAALLTANSLHWFHSFWAEPQLPVHHGKLNATAHTVGWLNPGGRLSPELLNDLPEILRAKR
ncbi:hypothetical protein PHYPSEUDO_014874 [Phytophthora pseudosyringae]|uniref:Uncharacterized protein n=1 Tax=Phytophthora pseudosyringae TaxID=221518 RepID=A0A8T1W357_9STRA|nr:hypothetical protein PHYPSEUDO_014874 [Phytophthora pseudosyringae]